MGRFQRHCPSKLKPVLCGFESKVKGNMANKKDKRGTPHTELTPEARSAANVKSGRQKYHLSTGSASTELSETTGQDPQARAASRGVKNAPKKRLPNLPSGAGY